MRRETTSMISFSAMWGYSTRAGTCEPAGGLAAGIKPASRHLDSGLPRLQNCEEKNVCSLSHLISGILLLQPELNQTSGNLCFPQIWLLSEIRALQRTWAGGLILQPKALLCTPVQKAWSPRGSRGPGRSVVARVSMQGDMTFLSLQSIKLQSLPSLLLLPELKTMWNRQWSSSPSTWHVDSLKGRYLILTFLPFLLLPYLFSHLLLQLHTRPYYFTVSPLCSLWSVLVLHFS